MIDLQPRKRFAWIGAPLLFFGVVLVYIDSPISTSLDSMWTVPTALSMLREGNTDLNEYTPLLELKEYYAVEEVGGRLYSLFPLGPSLMVLPFVYTMKKGFGNPDNELPGMRACLDGSGATPAQVAESARFNERLEKIAASMITALAAMLVFLIALLFLKVRYALLLALVFAFSSSAWSMTSRGMWQHGPSMLMLALTLYLVLRAREKPWLIQLAGLPLAFSFVIRPVNALSILAFSLYVVIRYPRYLVFYLLWAAAIAVPFFAYNLQVYDALLPPYYLPGRLGAHPCFWEALAGNLVSPARGLFVYSPVLLFSFFGAALLIRRRALGLLDLLLLATLFFHWAAISSYRHWWGGNSYGPRFFSDMLPYLIYFLIPVMAWLENRDWKRKAPLLALFLVLALAGLWIHCQGARTRQVHVWNYEPVPLEEDPSRLWDWSDAQFLRSLH